MWDLGYVGMISNYGFFCLANDTYELALDVDINTVSYDNGKLKKTTPEQGLANIVCIINVTDKNIEILPYSQVKVNGEIIHSNFLIKENDVIQVGLVKFKLLFKPYNFEKLDSLIDLYLDGQLPHFLSATNLFVQYADYLNITDKQAAFILASIDIPELEIRE